jgi:hypothetical protein
VPFRDADRSELDAFAAHLQFAGQLLGVVRDLTVQITHAEDRAPLVQSRGEAWTALWERLGEARAIVVRLGRDLARYDDLRGHAGNPYMDAINGLQSRLFNVAAEAIDALRAIVPEVTVPAAPREASASVGYLETVRPQHVWRPSGMFWARVCSLIVLALLGASRAC